MKIKFLQLSLMGVLSVAAVAQNPGEKKPEIKYRRSSLHMIMLDDAGLIKANIIKDAFTKAPIPDKYNDHSLPQKSFVPSKYALTAEEKAAIGSKSDSKGKAVMKGLASSATGGLVDTTNTKETPAMIEKYLKQNGVARDMVAKWFNRDANGAFNMDLIGSRGSYDASALQVNKAKGSARGMASIADAGVELIGNTFVVATRFNYVSKKEIYEAAQRAKQATSGATGALAGKLKSKAGVPSTNVPSNPALEAAKAEAIKKLTEGYIVQCTSYLYQLVWNDSVEAVFYNDLWMDASSIDPKKKEAFDKTDLFTFKLIGDGKATANVPVSLKKKRSDDELVAIATNKATDAVIAKLQRQYEVFKTKVPLYSGDPLTAKIGLKEGLEGGDKFEVLEQTLDEKTGRTKYVRKGKIKVIGDQIWDNRYNLGEEDLMEPVAVDTTKGAAPPKPPVDKTFFKGGKKFYAGMLIRQIK
ncbi:MAG: hypothetical protein ACXVNM_07780 [Bacteroidia bacterium]